MNIINFINFFVPKKDLNIILRHQLSWYLVPLLLILWFIFPVYHYILSTFMFCIVFIGIIETIFYSPVTILSKIYSIILHLILLIPIFYYKIFNSKIIKNINKNPKKSCLQKNNFTKKTKNVKFSSINKNFYKNDIRYLLRFNIWNLLLLIISILIINYLPYWPYYMSRKLMCYLLIIITSILWIYAEYF